MLPTTYPSEPTPPSPLSPPASISAADAQLLHDEENDYGVLLSAAGTLADGSDVTDGAAGHQLKEIRAGRPPSPEPVYSTLAVDYADDPYLGHARQLIGTWKLVVTFGNLRAETPSTSPPADRHPPGRSTHQRSPAPAAQPTW